jgi:hypothetical protein
LLQTHKNTDFEHLQSLSHKNLFHLFFFIHLFINFMRWVLVLTYQMGVFFLTPKRTFFTDQLFFCFLFFCNWFCLSHESGSSFFNKLGIGQKAGSTIIISWRIRPVYWNSRELEMNEKCMLICFNFLQWSPNQSCCLLPITISIIFCDESSPLGDTEKERQGRGSCYSFKGSFSEKIAQCWIFLIKFVKFRQ